MLEDRLVPTSNPFLIPDLYHVSSNQTLSRSAAEGVLANDEGISDAQITAVSGQSVNVGQPIVLGSGCEVTIYADGSFVFTPASNHIGSEALTYTVSGPDFIATTSLSIFVLPTSTTVGSVVIQEIADRFNFEGDSVSLTVVASTTGSEALSYSANWLPDGLAIDSESGIISGTLLPGAAVPSVPVTVTASDGFTSPSIAFEWQIDSPVVVTELAQRANVEGTAVSFQVEANTFGGNAPTFSADWLPAGLSINPTTGWITGTILAGEATPEGREVEILAFNGTYTGSGTFLWQINSPVVVTAINDRNDYQGDSVALQVTASGPGGTFTYSAADLPEGLSIDEETGLITGTIPTDAETELTKFVTVHVTDGTYTGTTSFLWKIWPRMIIGEFADQVGVEGESVNLPLTATILGVNPLTFSATGLPTGLSIDPATGLISGTLTSGSATLGTPKSVTVTATDGTYTATKTVLWTVETEVAGEGVEAETDTYSVGAGGTLVANESQVNNPSLLANDEVMGTASLAVTAINGITSAIGSTITLSSGATLSADSLGRFIYHAASGFVGTDSFTYTVANVVVEVYVKVHSWQLASLPENPIFVAANLNLIPQLTEAEFAKLAQKPLGAVDYAELYDGITTQDGRMGLVRFAVQHAVNYPFKATKEDAQQLSNLFGMVMAEYLNMPAGAARDRLGYQLSDQMKNIVSAGNKARELLKQPANIPAGEVSILKARAEIGDAINRKWVGTRLADGYGLLDNLKLRSPVINDLYAQVKALRDEPILEKRKAAESRVGQYWQGKVTNGPLVLNLSPEQISGVAEYLRTDPRILELRKSPQVRQHLFEELGLNEFEK